MSGAEKGGLSVPDEVSIERMERDVLLQISAVFKCSLREFEQSVERSLRYLDKVILPTVISSKVDRSYNPFAEIIEKYATDIIKDRMEREGYRHLPLGYSADLTLENDEHIVSIDIKTASLDNLSDFRRTVNVGINQVTHVASLPLKGGEGRLVLPEPYLVYPTIPPYYAVSTDRGVIVKPVLTYGLIFIYPSYRDLIEGVRSEYEKLAKIVERKVRAGLPAKVAGMLGVGEEEARLLLEKEDKVLEPGRLKLVVENLIRGVYVHEHLSYEILDALKLTDGERRVFDSFRRKLREFEEGLRERDVRPIAIVIISIPNGLLWRRYLSKFVSGKNYAKSARYHYGEGVFEYLRKEPGGRGEDEESLSRVLLLHVKEEYKEEIRGLFGELYFFGYRVGRL